jgi:hypothetical protein
VLVGLAIAAVFLLGVTFAYVWLGSGSAPTATTGSPPATPTPGGPPATATPASPPATAGPTASAVPNPSPTPTNQSADIAAQVDEVMAQVPPIRELDPLRDTPLKIQSQQEFHDFLQEAIKDQVDPALLAAQQRLLQRLGLLPDDANLEQMLVDLQSGAASAYYRFDDQTMYVIENGTPFDAAERWFVSHEYTHALDDQHFQIGANQVTDPSQGDAALADLGVIEGDATTTMFKWSNQYLSPLELIEVSLLSLTGDDGQLLASMPPYLVRQLSFPYQEGYTFVSGLQTNGGWAAVNEALQNPPPSTEQVLHPEKYTAHEAPIQVQLKDPTAGLGGGGWSQTYVDTVGELNMQMFVAGGEQPDSPIPGLPMGEWPHAGVAAGWGGDRIAMWERDESGSWAIAWRTAWDSKADADEFVARAAQLQSTLDGVSKIDRTSDTEVLLLVASAETTLHELESALKN